MYSGPAIVVEQSLVAGGQWDGSRPSASATSIVDGVKIFPPEAGVAGGRFASGPIETNIGGPTINRSQTMEWDTPARYMLIERVTVDAMGLAGAATWSIEIVTAAGLRTLWLTGAGATVTLITDELKLAVDEHLELTTSVAAAGACMSRIVARSLGIVL